LTTVSIGTAAVSASDNAVSRDALRTGRVLVFVTLLASIAWFSPVTGMNGNSRLALILSVVEHGELSIDRYHAAGPLMTIDKAYRDGRYYSDKAIGTALVGIPLVWAAQPALTRIHSPELRAKVAAYLVTLAVSGVPVALFGAWLFGVLLASGRSPAGASLIALAAVLGTPLWPLATMLFGHALAAILLVAAFAAFRAVRSSDTSRPAVRLALGAFALGMAAVTEYTVAPLCAVLGAYGLWCARTARRLTPAVVLSCVVAAAVPLLMLAVYNTLCFGSPLSLGYQHLPNARFSAVHAGGVVGVGVPSWHVLTYLTVHPVRGLFAQSPLLLLAAAGLVAMSRTRGWRVEATAIGACVIILLLANAGFPIWWGGYSSVARHLGPCLALLALGLAFLPRTRVATILLIVLGSLSFAQMAAITFASPVAPDEALDAALSALPPNGWLPWFGYSPVFDFAVPQLQAREIRKTVASLAGIDGPGALVPVFVAWGLSAACILALQRRTMAQRLSASP
jgi:hypothetical protein